MLAGGSCTRATLGGTSGTVVSTTSLPARCGLISSRMAAWLAQGTVMNTTSRLPGGICIVGPHQPAPAVVGGQIDASKGVRPRPRPWLAEREPITTA